MIASKLSRREFPDYNLGGKEPPSEVVTKLASLRVPCEAVWNEDDNQWEVYRLLRKDTLTWQMSAPNKGPLITPGIATWIQKYDTSEHGKFDDEERVAEYTKYGFQASLDRMAEYKAKGLIEAKREVAEVSKYLARMVFGTRAVVVPGPPIGTHKGKPVRMYKKNGK